MQSSMQRRLPWLDRDVHRCKGETMSHQGGNTLRTALIAVAAAAVFILGCGLFTLHVRARSAAHIAWAEMQCSTSGHECQCESQSGSVMGREHCVRMLEDAGGRNE